MTLGKGINIYCISFQQKNYCLAEGNMWSIKNPIRYQWVTWNFKTPGMTLKTDFTEHITKLYGIRNSIMYLKPWCPIGFPRGLWNNEATKAFAFPLCKSTQTSLVSFEDFSE